MKRVLVIYVPAVIHWIGVYFTIGLLWRLFAIPGLAVFSLCILAFLCLPIPFAVEEKEEDE